MIRFMKCGDVKSPTRGTELSSGIDFYIPNDFKPVFMNKGDSILIPSGLKCIIQPGYDLTLKEKSGVALNKGLNIGACIIDADYRGEFNIHLIKTHGDTIKLNPGDKIVQGIVRKVELCDIELISQDEFEKENNTERGNGGFGSTGIS